MFGIDRLLTALNKNPDAPLKELLENVCNAVDGFVKEAEQFDDLTMLCLEYRNDIRQTEQQNAKAILVDRQTDIADYDMHIQALQSAFLRSLELNENAERRK